ncbi:SURF1 family cytochrome oxidase biogenesis protein [Spongiactinospora gelatinilytica]|uniref:SURF1 family cytochrome oxidase biogenesis protein n=1 Tax=Spongiactinospora gelatinilytica TaxID=2666298 RepID=UPI001F2BA33F|nr:SURF1 family protein [Spongiactinospora gelatinilytica]
MLRKRRRVLADLRAERPGSGERPYGRSKGSGAYPEVVYRFLLTPRWLVLHVVVLLVIPAFVFLGRWQFGRYEERSGDSERITASLHAPAVPLARLAPPGGPSVRPADEYRAVEASGTYDAGHGLLVRRRPQNGMTGYYVLTPLVTAPGQAVIVNRGWVPAGATADTPPQVPPPPTGQVTVTGRLRLAENEESAGIRDRRGLPPGQVLLIDTAAIGAGLPYKIVDGYVELTAQRPAPARAPEPVPAPDVASGGGLNLAYGVQWWLFIAIAVGGWIFLIRREAADIRAGTTETDSANTDEERQEEPLPAAERPG